MRININRIPFGGMFVLEVKPYYTGFSIKKKIEYLYDFSCNDYVLTFGSVRFKDNNVIFDFDVEDGNMMNLINIKSEDPTSFPIFYRTTSEETKLVYVRPYFTIGILKLMIFGKTGIPPLHMWAVFEAKPLKDECTLSYYNIKKGCKVDILIRGG